MATNRDKFNAMSNKELAKRLGCQCCIYLKKKGSGTGPACSAPFGDVDPFCHEGIVKWLEDVEPFCHEGIVKWLESEVDE